jgi:hypothetical protein
VELPVGEDEEEPFPHGLWGSTLSAEQDRRLKLLEALVRRGSLAAVHGSTFIGVFPLLSRAHGLRGGNSPHGHDRREGGPLLPGP